MTTLTTVGYGDVTPVTPAGKVFAMMTMLAGLCILALPVAIISTGFAQEVGRRSFVITWSLMSRIPLLAGLDARQVAEIMPLFHAHQFPPGYEVVPAGTVSNATWFVASGRIELRTRDFARTYETGDFFGIVSMLEGDRTPGAFVTLTKCRLLKLHRDDFRRLEAMSPAIAAHVRSIASARRTARETAERAAGRGPGHPGA
jgi:voltage-gated potassium channel